MEKSRKKELMKLFYHCVEQYDEWIQEDTEHGMIKHKFFEVRPDFLTSNPPYHNEVYKLFYIKQPNTQPEIYFEISQDDDSRFQWLETESKIATTCKMIRNVKRLQKHLDKKQVEKESGIRIKSTLEKLINAFKNRR
jgi:hypothetical protein